MEFGKPANPELVDWTLAKDTDLTSHVLSELSPKPTLCPQIYLGSTSWGDKAYLGEVYPAKTKANDYLSAYGEQFNTIELNTTFYRMPQVEQTRGWSEKTPADFRFCPKVNKLISQSKMLGVGTNRIKEFCSGIKGFGQKLGPSFIQLPSHFDISNFDSIRRFLDHWPKDLKLAVELRHESWFAESKGADLFAELFTRGHGTTISDVGARRDVAHMNITANFFLLRWVGLLHQTDEKRLIEWANRLASWIDKGLNEAYIFTHQVVAPEAAKSAIDFERFLRKSYPAPLEVRSPKLLIDEGPKTNQIELFG